jgi:translation initiation factor IF-1
MPDRVENAGRRDRRAEGAEKRVPGRVVEQLPNALYRVELASEGRPKVTAHAAGESGLLRLRPGDAVEVELSSYDPGRARIVGRG